MKSVSLHLIKKLDCKRVYVNASETKDLSPMQVCMKSIFEMNEWFSWRTDQSFGLFRFVNLGWERFC